jgi:integrase
MLSDTKARAAKAASKPYKLADEKGLFLLVNPNGSRLWRLKYRIGGKEKLLAFGSYPDVGLAAARDLRDAARKLLAAGTDPAQDKKRVAAEARAMAANAFEPVAREWHEHNKDRWTSVHAADILRSLERDVFPTIGKEPLVSIDAPMLLGMLRKVERRGSVETARRIRQRISAVFVYAISSGVAKDDPAAIIEKAMARKPKAKRQPAVTDIVELRKLIDKSETSGVYPVTALASRLLALTAVRPGVVRGARWAEFHGIDWETGETRKPVWHIPAERMKLSLDRKDEEAFDHIAPLPPQAVAVLLATRPLSGRGDIVFPGQRHAHRPLSENAIGYLYNRVGWHHRHVPHGWRSAFSTVMNERAVVAGNHSDRAVIDLMLAHMPSNKIEGAYNRAEFMDRRREIAEEWAELLLAGARPASDLLSLARRSAPNLAVVKARQAAEPLRLVGNQ